MPWRCPKKSLLISALLLLSLLAGCRARHFPLPPLLLPPVIVPVEREHARERHHRYRYFPGSQVYFDQSRNIYFYLSNNGWLSVPVLPPHLHLDMDDFVTLELAGPQPHLYHRDIIKRYPPGHFKKGQQDKRHRAPQAVTEKELEKEKRANDKERRKIYRDREQERRSTKKEKRRGYRDGEDEHRDDKGGLRQKSAEDDDDEEEEEGNGKNGRRKNDKGGWRGSDQ